MAQERQRSDEDQSSEAREFPVGDRGPFKGPGPARSDDDIRSDVESALFYDEFVSSLDIKVMVQGGTVTLTGTVNSELNKRRAAEDAWRVVGVRNVMNDLAAVESPIPSRAAGQDEVSAKPPESIYGQPPSLDREAGAEPQPPPKTQSGGQQRTV